MTEASICPEGTDEDPFMYLDTQIYDALHALTELQREILFRTIINGESTESVAQDKQCSSRNIRDIRTRALRQIRAKINRREGYGRPGVVIIILLFMLLVGVPLACWGEQLGPHIPGWSLWLQCLAHWLWRSCSKIPFAEKQKGCCASIGPA
ncbi:MAG: hypothetical protein V8S87_10440 [Oscillospiraceae bacterium]